VRDLLPPLLLLLLLMLLPVLLAWRSEEQLLPARMQLHRQP
jgi:hypothetical protein